MVTFKFGNKEIERTKENYGITIYYNVYDKRCNTGYRVSKLYGREKDIESMKKRILSTKNLVDNCVILLFEGKTYFGNIMNLKEI